MAKILVVDDEPQVRRVLARLFSSKGHDVRVASDGVEALAAVRDHAPDLMILDYRMPRMDGAQVLESLPPGRKPLVLMVTAYADVDLVRRVVRRGVYDYLLKPFDIAYVAENVEQALLAARRA